ncbi:MAG: TonB-dependent receptor plug domain-containing protein [Nitrospirae bacterium]|nr:TonB-dependent receptor plug domain-containing protein [Nitrospirota bacterium]MBF0616075.1 TonB-dependent receptor plug domain-containing protein [Nitrospirota bacterium]
MALLLSSNSIALSWTDDTDEKVLSMYFKKEDLVITPTRYLKSTSQVAENIVVITASDIEAIGAVTLADVLKYVIGFQTRMIPGGAGVESHIQGTETTNHVRVIIDGVTLNDISLGTITLQTIPVENIERIEIIKGPASSTWGSSLGGIINIITKDNYSEKPISMKLQGAYGSYNTQDERVVLNGKVGPLGYYVFYGRQFSDGYNSELSNDQHNFYSKFKVALSQNTVMRFTLGYNKTSGEPINPQMTDYNDSLYTTLNVNSKLSESTDFNVSLRTSDFYHTVEMVNGKEIVKDTDYGGSVNVKWSPPGHSVVTGGDYDYQILKTDTIESGKAYFTKWAVFVNDTIPVSRFTITPGIRYDWLTQGGAFVSPGLGVTYDLGKTTLLRFFVTRGFNAVPAKYSSVSIRAGDTNYIANPELKVEKVISYQAGIESGILKYLWFKTSLFRHDVWDAFTMKTISSNTFQMQNDIRQIRQGVEVETETAPIYHTTITLGCSYTDAKNADTGQKVEDTPQYSYDLGVEYRNPKVLNASLKGHYIRWYYDPSKYDNYYTFLGNNAMIFDLNLSKEVYRDNNLNVGLFVKGNNIFNDSLIFYANHIYNGRIIYGGVKVNF